VHEGVEIECLVEGIGEAMEELELERFDARAGGSVDGYGLRMGPVVAFEWIIGLLAKGEMWRTRGLFR